MSIADFEIAADIDHIHLISVASLIMRRKARVLFRTYLSREFQNYDFEIEDFIGHTLENQYILKYVDSSLLYIIHHTTAKIIANLFVRFRREIFQDDELQIDKFIYQTIES